MRRRASVQTLHLRLERIADDILDLGGGRCRAVLAVRGVPFALLGERERAALTAGYISFLNALAYPIQVLIRTVPLDWEGYLAPLEARLDASVPGGTEAEQNGMRDRALGSRVDPVHPGALSPALAALARDHAAFVRRLAGARALLTRQHYLVVPADDGAIHRERPFPFRLRQGPTPVGTARRLLAARCDEVRVGLGRCGLDARRLASRDLAELCAACWRPERAADQRLRAELRAFEGLMPAASRLSSDGRS